MRVGIAGIGGIGSNVAMHLVRSGVTDFTFADFDTIEPSNLNRQFYFSDQIGEYKTVALKQNLLRINSSLDIVTHTTRVEPDNIGTIFSDCEVVVEGFDQTRDKKILLEQFSQSPKLIVSANGIAGDSTDTIVEKKIGNTFIVGDFTTDCSDAPLFSHKVMIVAASLAKIILQQKLIKN